MSAPDFYNLIAKERGAPDGWRWFSLRAIGDGSREHGVVLVTGAICTAIYKRGKHKGATNWTKRDKSTEREFAISMKDYDARIAQWEQDTGTCATCGGSGQSVASIGRDGTTYRDCRKCNATGKAGR